MINPKEILLRSLVDKASIKCAYVKRTSGFNNTREEIIFLKLDYTETDYKEFLSGLDFDCVGSEDLVGTVWLEDNSWLSWKVFDGEEEWEYNKLPEIPDVCF